MILLDKTYLLTILEFMLRSLCLTHPLMLLLRWLCIGNGNDGEMPQIAMF